MWSVWIQEDHWACLGITNNQPLHNGDLDEGRSHRIKNIRMKWIKSEGWWQPLFQVDPGLKTLLYWLDSTLPSFCHQWFYLPPLGLDLSLLSDAGQQDFPVHDQQCASYGRLLLCNRLWPDTHTAAPGQHQPWVSGDEPSGEGKITFI